MRYNNRYEWHKHRQHIARLVTEGKTTHHSENFDFKIRELEPIIINDISDAIQQQIKVGTRVETLNNKICKVIPSRLNFE